MRSGHGRLKQEAFCHADGHGTTFAAETTAERVAASGPAEGLTTKNKKPP
jgi:hypothetical protein